MLQTRGMLLNPLKPNSSNYYTLAFKPNLPFLISDIQALWRSALSARVPECQKLKMVGYVFIALNIQSVTTGWHLAVKG